MLTQIAGHIAQLIVPALIIWALCRPESPAKAPSRPSEPFSPGDAAGAAVGYVVTLATLCWLAIMLAVFVAPLGLLVWWLAS